MLPGLAPAGKVLFFLEKDPKPLTLSPTSLDRTAAEYKRAVQLAEAVLSRGEGLKQGPPRKKSARPHDRTAGVVSK